MLLVYLNFAVYVSMPKAEEDSAMDLSSRLWLQSRELSWTLDQLGVERVRDDPSRGWFYKLVLAKFSEEVQDKADVLLDEMKTATLEDWHMLAPTLQHLIASPTRQVALTAENAMKKKKVFDSDFAKMSEMIQRIHARKTKKQGEEDKETRGEKQGEKDQETKGFS